MNENVSMKCALTDSNNGLMNLSASLEDYLELICNLSEKYENVKAVDIAKRFNISRASVSEAIMRLSERNLIINEGHKGITITPEGLKKAKEVIDKHNTLTDFFEYILGLEHNIAEDNACKIEHIVNADIVERIKKFINFCKINDNLIKNFKEGNINSYYE